MEQLFIDRKTEKEDCILSILLKYGEGVEGRLDLTMLILPQKVVLVYGAWSTHTIRFQCDTTMTVLN